MRTDGIAKPDGLLAMGRPRAKAGVYAVWRPRSLVGAGMVGLAPGSQRICLVSSDSVDCEHRNELFPDHSGNLFLPRACYHGLLFQAIADASGGAWTDLFCHACAAGLDGAGRRCGNI